MCMAAPLDPPNSSGMRSKPEPGAREKSGDTEKMECSLVLVCMFFSEHIPSPTQSTGAPQLPKWPRHVEGKRPQDTSSIGLNRLEKFWSGAREMLVTLASYW